MQEGKIWTQRGINMPCATIRYPLITRLEKCAASIETHALAKDKHTQAISESCIIIQRTSNVKTQLVSGEYRSVIMLAFWHVGKLLGLFCMASGISEVRVLQKWGMKTSEDWDNYDKYAEGPRGFNSEVPSPMTPFYSVVNRAGRV